jgi:exodeoxyribonuclease V gamma subunit
MREVEVLRDVLIDMFERDAELQPHDVLVMTPDMQAYAPFIEAVFGSVERGSPGYVPFRISDTGGPAGDDAASAFLALLGLLDGRMGASAVLDLVAMEAVRARFGIEDMDQVSRWVRESGVRWGVDGVHRREEGQDFDENTWRFGLDRLLLGHAMEGRDATLWASTLPHDDVEGGATADLGRLVDLLETLFGLRREAMSAMTLGGWSIALGRMLDAMIDASGPRAREAGRIRRILEDLGDMEACFGEHVGLAVVRSEIERVVGESRSVHQFLAGGVTFCEMLPMRSIPVRVVCLLGMNDDAFPRTSRTPGFDLAAATRLPGDRSSREDDRYMFLEALLSARDALVVTYVGQSLRDSAAYPPSVVVSELLDVLDEGGRVVVRHPMQAFSPRYFSPSGGLVSYSEANARAAARLVRGRHGPVPFVTGPVEDPGWDGTVTLDDLVRFFSGPGRWFLQRRLGMYVDAAGDVTDDREPLVLDPPEGHALGARLLGHAVAGGRASDLHAAVRASGRLPPGSVGDVELDDRVPWAGAIARVRERHARGEPRVVPIDIEIGGTRLRGRLEGVRPGGLVTHDFGKLDARRELVLWIRHLVLCAASPGGRPPASVLVCRSADGGRVQATTLGPVDDALAHLGTLLGLLAQGRSAPLPFFPAASRRYAAELGGKGHEAALESAAGAFAGTRWQRGDGDDPYVAVAYRGTDPLADPFCEVAVRVWGPFLDHGRGGG